MEQRPITIKPLSQCTFEQAAALWNSGFQNYYSDMSRTVDRHARQIGINHIHPTLSVTAFAGDEPAGFVLFAVFEAAGRKLAWNGGTGVNPAFRGIGLAKCLMNEAMAAVRSAGINSALLEVVSDNGSAITVYEHAGFQAVDHLIGMKHEGAFESLPFARIDDGCYLTRRGRPIEAFGLPFYRHRSAWTSQWFSLDGGEALFLYDSKGAIAAYALYRRVHDQYGALTSIVLHQCEPAPGRNDAEQAVRFALAEVFGPLHIPLIRTADNLRASNELAVAALREAGFAKLYEQKLMWIDFTQRTRS